MTGEIESNKKLCWKVSDVDEISIHEWKHRYKLRCYFSIIPTKLKLRIPTMKVFTTRLPSSEHPFFYFTFWNLMKLQIQHGPTGDKGRINSSKRRLLEICFKRLYYSNAIVQINVRNNSETNCLKKRLTPIMERKSKKVLERRILIFKYQYTKNIREKCNEIQNSCAHRTLFFVDRKNSWRDRIEYEFFLRTFTTFKICFSTFATNLLLSDLSNYPKSRKCTLKIIKYLYLFHRYTAAYSTTETLKEKNPIEIQRERVVPTHLDRQNQKKTQFPIIYSYFLLLFSFSTRIFHRNRILCKLG